MPIPTRASRPFEPTGEPRTGAPWLGLILSLGLHGLGLGLWLTHWVLPAPASDAVIARDHSMPVFVPPPQPPAAPPPETPPPGPNPFAAPSILPPPADAPPPDQPVRVDMNAIRLSFAVDVSNQLPDVIEHQGGMLALIDKADPSFARYIIKPPDWRVRETLLDISGKVRFEMYPPRKWRLIDALARQAQLPLDHFQVCALFDGSYRRCLEEAIRSKAASAQGAGSGRVESARLAFNRGSHCGVDVLGVSFAAAPSTSP